MPLASLRREAAVSWQYLVVQHLLLTNVQAKLWLEGEGGTLLSNNGLDSFPTCFCTPSAAFQLLLFPFWDACLFAEELNPRRIGKALPTGSQAHSHDEVQLDIRTKFLIVRGVHQWVRLRGRWWTLPHWTPSSRGLTSTFWRCSRTISCCRQWVGLDDLLGPFQFFESWSTEK